VGIVTCISLHHFCIVFAPLPIPTPYLTVTCFVGNPYNFHINTTLIHNVVGCCGIDVGFLWFIPLSGMMQVYISYP
jgi:hypothetical protein